jgi:hypothetical protein
MEWLRRNKLKLAGVLAASAFVSVLELRWARSAPGRVVEPWQLGLIMLPWFITAATLLCLCYLLWFGRAGNAKWVLLGKLVFWSIAASFGAMFISIYGSFVFEIF